MNKKIFSTRRKRKSEMGPQCPQSRQTGQAISLVWLLNGMKNTYIYIFTTMHFINHITIIYIEVDDNRCIPFSLPYILYTFCQSSSITMKRNSISQLCHLYDCNIILYHALHYMPFQLHLIIHHQVVSLPSYIPLIVLIVL